jgi:hypothetical protein
MDIVKCMLAREMEGERANAYKKMNKEQERRIMFIDASGLYDKAPVYFELT